MSLYRHRRSCVKLELLLQLSSSSSPLAHTRCCCCVSAPAHSLRSCRSCRLAAHSRAVAVAADRPQVTTLALLLLLFSCHRAYRRIVPPYRAALFSALSSLSAARLSALYYPANGVKNRYDHGHATLMRRHRSPSYDASTHNTTSAACARGRIGTISVGVCLWSGRETARINN